MSPDPNIKPPTAPVPPLDPEPVNLPRVGAPTLPSSRIDEKFEEQMDRLDPEPEDGTDED